MDLLSRIFDCFNSFEPSIPTQLKSPKGNQSIDENESKEESDSEEEADIKKQPTRRFEHPKVNVSIDLPSYDGRKGKARVFIDKFLALCKANHFDKDQWDSLLSACLKKDALKFFNNKRKLYPKWNDFFNKFTNFFDNKSSDNEFYWFHKIFQQNDGQDFGPWFLIFEEKVQQMQAINQYPAYDEPTFHQTYMRDLYCKLNKSCFTIVDKRLKEYGSGKEAKDVTEEHFKSWIDEATSETKNACAFSNLISHLDNMGKLFTILHNIRSLIFHIRNIIQLHQSLPLIIIQTLRTHQQRSLSATIAVIMITG